MSHLKTKMHRYNLKTKLIAVPKDLTNIERVTVIGEASSERATLGGINLKDLPINRHVVPFEELDRLKFVDSDDANTPESEFTRDERINLRVSYDIDNWNLGLHALNLTDTLEDRATYSRGKMKFRTADGRTIYAGVSYNF